MGFTGRPYDGGIFRELLRIVDRFAELFVVIVVHSDVGSGNFGIDRIAYMIAGRKGLFVVFADIFIDQAFPCVVARDRACFDSCDRAVTVDYNGRRPTGNVEFGGKTVEIAHERESETIVFCKFFDCCVGIDRNVVVYSDDFDYVAVFFVDQLHIGHFLYAPGTVRAPVVDEKDLLFF